jgi:UbiA prenyltransferase family
MTGQRLRHWMKGSLARVDVRRQVVAGARSVWLGLARLARAKYLALEIPAFTVGFLSSGSHSYTYLALGYVAIVLFLLVTSYSNTLSDRAEDAIDYPERTLLAQLVGYDKIRYATITAIALYPVVMIFMIWPGHMRPYWVAGWLLVLTLTASYSFGIKLKTKRLVSPIVTGGTAAGFLLLGYVGTSVAGHNSEMLASFVLLWEFGVCLYWVGYKDLANIAGDTAIGFRSTYWSIISGRHPAARAVFLLASPYALLIILVTVGLLRPFALIALLLIPVCVSFAIALAKGRGPSEGIAIRDLGNVYWQLFAAPLLFALYPRAVTPLIVALGLAWYFFASFVLHHDPPPLHRDNLKAVYTVMKAHDS